MVKGINLVFYRSLCRYSYDWNITCFQIGFQFINQAQAVHVGQDHLSPRKDTVILIVEDEKNIRDLLKDVLFDYVIHEAKDGVEALKEIEHNHPDIIISDIVMPNMDGLSLINKLK